MRVTLEGTRSLCIVSTPATEFINFYAFIKWLTKYNPTTSKNIKYPISSEKRLQDCRIQARKFGLNVMKTTK